MSLNTLGPNPLLPNIVKSPSTDITQDPSWASIVARARLVGGDAAYGQLVAQVVGLVEAPALGLALPLDVRGTAFQQRVWLALREIPAGKRETYSSIAQKIGSPRSVRAVAGACAGNAHALAIPCHRVVRDDGRLAGYHWGVERKRELIDREHPEQEQAA